MTEMPEPLRPPCGQPSPFGIAGNGNETEVVDAVREAGDLVVDHRLNFRFGGRTMRRQQDRMIPEHLHERFQAVEDGDIGVEIDDPVLAELLLEQLHCRGFDARACLDHVEPEQPRRFIGNRQIVDRHQPVKRLPAAGDPFSQPGRRRLRQHKIETVAGVMTLDRARQYAGFSQVTQRDACVDGRHKKLPLLPPTLNR